jgi:hypothetical protein
VRYEQMPGKLKGGGEERSGGRRGVPPSAANESIYRLSTQVFCPSDRSPRGC